MLESNANLVRAWIALAMHVSCMVTSRLILDGSKLGLATLAAMMIHWPIFLLVFRDPKPKFWKFCLGQFAFVPAVLLFYLLLKAVG